MIKVFEDIGITTCLVAVWVILFSDKSKGILKWKQKLKVLELLCHIATSNFLLWLVFLYF